MSLPAKWQWFADARFGMFIHWGPYAMIGRGEQSLFRDHLDQREYAAAACKWNPQHYDAKAWARTAVEGGMRYAVLTTRHHDGYCLWDTKTTDYSSGSQVPRRDFVREYVDAFRAAGIRVGLYYSLCDWRIPAYWEGPDNDAAGFERFIDYVHAQVGELLSNYGDIDVIWFDGAWPHNAQRWRALEMVRMMRKLQPNILINNRLDWDDCIKTANAEAAGASEELGDFGTPEHHITADASRIWESCNTSTWRLWGYTNGEQWRSAAQLLDMLVDASSKGGNLLLNVGPDAEGQLPVEYTQRTRAIGDWLKTHGEAIYGTQAGNVTEFVTYGMQTRRGNDLYLICRFWDGTGEVRLSGLQTRATRAHLLTTGKDVPFEQTADATIIKGLPKHRPTELFPVIRMSFEGDLTLHPWAQARLWGGDPRRMTQWAKARGESVWVDGKQR
jgi:alpha-L-fucosidase